MKPKSLIGSMYFGANGGCTFFIIRSCLMFRPQTSALFRCGMIRFFAFSLFYCRKRRILSNIAYHTTGTSAICFNAHGGPGTAPGPPYSLNLLNPDGVKTRRQEPPSRYAYDSPLTCSSLSSVYFTTKSTDKPSASIRRAMVCFSSAWPSAFPSARPSSLPCACPKACP